MQQGGAAQKAIGRFAPSPTGELHFGSLVAAIASYLEVRSKGGLWLVRVEDVDPPREVPGSAERILEELGRFGLRSDLPVLYQSSRTQAYLDARDRLLAEGHAFWCGCSRAELPDSGIYPGTCRNGLPEGKEPRAVRMRVDQASITFDDRIQGPISESLEESCGDFVIWRADGLPAYQLAVVVDDAFQRITEVVRGADLLDSTCRQIHLQQCLDLPTPSYAHHPVAVDQRGNKLSKLSGSDPLTTLGPEQVLLTALRFLGQVRPACSELEGLEELERSAIANWRLDRIPRTRQSFVEALRP